MNSAKQKQRIEEAKKLKSRSLRFSDAANDVKKRKREKVKKEMSNDKYFFIGQDR